MAELADTHPLVQLTAYVTDGRSLYEVIERDGPDVVLENCRTGNLFRITRSSLARYRLVKPAEPIPDSPIAA